LSLRCNYHMASQKVRETNNGKEFRDRSPDPLKLDAK